MTAVGFMDEYVPMILNANDNVTGQKLYEDYVSANQWRCQPIMGTNKEEQQDVHVCKQENHSKIPRQDCGSKRDQGLVWQVDLRGITAKPVETSTRKMQVGTTNSF